MATVIVIISLRLKQLFLMRHRNEFLVKPQLLETENIHIRTYTYIVRRALAHYLYQQSLNRILYRPLNFYITNEFLFYLNMPEKMNNFINISYFYHFNRIICDFSEHFLEYSLIAIVSSEYILEEIR